MSSGTAAPSDAANAAPRVNNPRAKGSLYRGDPGMWSWVAHRITGVLTFFFLFVHVLDIAMIRVSPHSFDDLIAVYKHPLMILLELGLFAAVLFHALNGVRVMLVDFWANGVKYQRPMLWTLLILWVLLVVPAAITMLTRLIVGLTGAS